MEKTGYQIKTAPSLTNMAASKPAPTTPKKTILKSPATSPKTPRAAASKPLSKEATQYALSALNPRKKEDDPQKCAKVWGQIEGYKRNFKHLNLAFNQRVTADSCLADLNGELLNIQNQMGDSKAVDTIRHLYCTLLDLFAKTTVVANPLDLKIQTLPQKAKTRVFNDGFLSQELTELSILYPEICRPGPLLTVFLQTLTLIRDVNDAESFQTNPNNSVSSAAANKYNDL